MAGSFLCGFFFPLSSFGLRISSSIFSIVMISFTIHDKLLFSFQLWQIALHGYSSLGWQLLLFRTWNTSVQALLAFKNSVESSAIILMDNLIYFSMTWCFSPVAFKMLCSVYVGCYVQFEEGGSFLVLSVWESYIIWISISFPISWKVSVLNLSKHFFMLLGWDSSSSFFCLLSIDLIFLDCHMYLRFPTNILLLFLPLFDDSSSSTLWSSSCILLFFP